MENNHSSGCACHFPKRRKSVERLFAWCLGHSNAMMARTYGEMKQALFANLAGSVLEIGPGAGANFAFYPKGVHVIGVEPNPYMLPYLEEEAEKQGLQLNMIEGYAETLQVADASVDAVVCTLVLCSVFSPEQALAEIRRVLKPGGQFLFIEHVAAPEGAWTRRFQNWLQPAWRFFGDGCNPNRETWTALEAAGFRDLALEHRRIKTPFKLIDPHILGKAIN